jgi:hypothetical protein
MWKSIKRVVSVTAIPSLAALKQRITKAWKELTVTRSCAKHWIEQFIPSVVTYKLSRKELYNGLREIRCESWETPPGTPLFADERFWGW